MADQLSSRVDSEHVADLDAIEIFDKKKYKEQAHAKKRLASLFGEIEKEFDKLLEENYELKRRLREYEQPSGAAPQEKKRLSSTLAKMLTGGSGSSSNTATPSNEKVKAKAPSRMQFVKDFANTVLQVPSVQRAKKVPANRRFLYHNDAVWVVECAPQTYSHDMNLLATASADHRLCLWYNTDRLLNPVVVYAGHKGSINAVRFHPERPIICTASGDRTCHILKINEYYSAISGGNAANSGNNGGQNNGRYSPDSSLISTNADQMVDHSNMFTEDDGDEDSQNDGADEEDFMDNPGIEIMASPISPNVGMHTTTSDEQPSVATSTQAFIPQPSNASYGQQYSQQQQQQQQPFASPHAKKSNKSLPVAIYREDVNDVITHEKLEKNASVFATSPSMCFASHSAPIVGCDWLLTTDQVVTASWDGDIRLFAIEGNAQQQPVEVIQTGTSALMNDVRCAYKSQLIVAGFADSSLRIWDLRQQTKSPIFTVPKAHPESISSAVFTANNNVFIISGSDDGTMKYWDMKNMKSAFKTVNTHSGINRIAVSDFNSRICVGLNKRLAKIYDLSGQCLQTIPTTHKGMITGACWSNDGNSSIFTSSIDKQVIQWSYASA